MKRKITKRERERNKTQEKTSVAQCSCSPPTAQPVPEQQSAPPDQLPPVYILSMTFDGMEYPFGLFRSTVLTVLPPSFSCTCLLAEHGKLKYP